MDAAVGQSPPFGREPLDLPPIGAVDNDALTEDDMMQFVSSAVDAGGGLVGHNTSSFNGLLSEGIPQILTKAFDISKRFKDERTDTANDRRRESVEVSMKFTDVKIGKPSYAMYETGKIQPMYPNYARISDKTYAGKLEMGVEVALTAFYSDKSQETKAVTVPKAIIANIPIMVGCERCHTWNLTREARKGLQEDPNESGGYFIARGTEWVVDWLENISFNTLHVYKKMAPAERVRGEFISQPGGAFENSSQVIIRYMAKGSLTIELNSTKFSRTQMPFYLMFRLLGVTSDREIFEHIVYDVAGETKVAQMMRETVEGAVHHIDPAYAEVHTEVDRARLLEFMAVRLSTFVTNPTAYKTDEEAVKYLNGNLADIIDRIFLPHLGQGPGDRAMKLRYLGMLIHKTLLVDRGILEPTDRDSYSNKRVHGAGVSIAKAFKTQFNNSIVIPVLKSLRRLLRATEFEALLDNTIITAVSNEMKSADLDRTLEQAITSGNKTIQVRRKAMTNRVSSQALERKNPANYHSALRGVSTFNASKAAAKQTERADKMRRVHSSYIGYICVSKSADTGEMVGMKKELALTATVCEASNPRPLIAHLRGDPAVTPAEAVETPHISQKTLACIFVNGVWVGCCADASRLVARYRALRRASQVVPPRATIVWNSVTDDIEFLLDVGRLTRPLLVVDSNLDEYVAARRRKEAGARFVQNVRLTPAHVAQLRAGALTIEDLRAAGVLEWVTPQEAENCLLAPSLDVLRRDRHDPAARYTHCDVEQAIFGLSALVSPLGNHTQPARVTYETNHARQSGGWYCFSAPFRVEKNRFFQHYCEVPLVRTLAYNWLYPNGMNTIVAYMAEGFNQEDSAIVKKSFAQRGGFAGAFYRYEKKELEKDCEFRTPDPAVTKNLRPGASYEKLVDGFTPPGTIVEDGDVVIGCVKKVTAAEGRRGGEAGYQYLDVSEVYRGSEPAVVTNVYTPHGPHDNRFAIVKLRFHRHMGVGDKMSSRAGNKSIMSREAPECDLPYDENGMTPDIIINPHSIPSRMTIGQMFETTLGLRCQEEGVVTDGTSHRKISIDEVAALLAQHGLRYTGKTRLFHGETGEHIDSAIFMGPTFHQRLQKFVKDDEYAVGAYGSTDPLTGQPLDGKNARGGLRVGEMEAWVLQAQGSMMALSEKIFTDSDGRKQTVCRRCGGPAIHNAAQGVYRCPVCRENADLGSLDSCKASVVFQQEMRAANVKVTLGTRPREFEEPAPAAAGPA